MERDREDNQLIDRFLKGDQEAFNMIVRKYQNRVFNTVYSLVGQTSSVDDIAQDVFIKVYNNLNSFNRRSAFSTWLYRITINTAYNYLRREKRYVSLEHEPKEEKFEKISLQDLEQKERQQLIQGAIEGLPFKYRTVIVLKDIEGLSYDDIAKTLGCRIGTVESRLFRARALLKKVLTPLMKESSNELQ